MTSHPIVVRPFNIPIHIGGLRFDIAGFGIAVLLAFLIAQLISQRELARRGYDLEARHVPDVLIAALAGTVLGGKLYFVGVITRDAPRLLSAQQKSRAAGRSRMDAHERLDRT